MSYITHVIFVSKKYVNSWHQQDANWFLLCRRRTVGFRAIHFRRSKDELGLWLWLPLWVQASPRRCRPQICSLLSRAWKEWGESPLPAREPVPDTHGTSSGEAHVGSRRCYRCPGWLGFRFLLCDACSLAPCHSLKRLETVFIFWKCQLSTKHERKEVEEKVVQN